MHVTHIRTPPYHTPRRTYAVNTDTRPGRVPLTRLRPPVTPAAAAPRRHSF